MCVCVCACPVCEQWCDKPGMAYVTSEGQSLKEPPGVGYSLCVYYMCVCVCVCMCVCVYCMCVLCVCVLYVCTVCVCV